MTRIMLGAAARRTCTMHGLPRDPLEMWRWDTWVLKWGAPEWPIHLPQGRGRDACIRGWGKPRWIDALLAAWLVACTNTDRGPTNQPWTGCAQTNVYQSTTTMWGRGMAATCACGLRGIICVDGTALPRETTRRTPRTHILPQVVQRVTKRSPVHAFSAQSRS